MRTTSPRRRRPGLAGVALALVATLAAVPACGPAGPKGPAHPEYARFAPSPEEEAEATRARPRDDGDPLLVDPVDGDVADELTAVVEAYAAATAAPRVVLTALRPGAGAFRLGVDAPPPSAEEPFQVHSVTKLVVALATMRLHELGVIDVDGPIPDLGVAGQEQLDEVAWWDLLTHRVRLADYRGLVEDGEVLDAGEVVARVLAAGPVEVAEEPAYANSGYVLLGLALEAATGRPWADVVHDEVLARAGLHATFVAPPEVAGPRHASGALFSTTDDLVRLAVAALRDGRVVRASSLHRLVAATPASPGPGLFVWCPCTDDDGVDRVVGLGPPGHSTFVTYMPARDVVVALDRGDTLWEGAMPATEGLAEAVAEALTGAAP